MCNINDLTTHHTEAILATYLVGITGVGRGLSRDFRTAFAGIPLDL